MDELFICDAQVHAPDLPTRGRNHGIGMAELLAEMDAAGVDRSILVPLAGLVDEADPAGNLAASQFAVHHPDRFGVMGLVPLHPEERRPTNLTQWRDTPGMLGIRTSFVRDPNRALLASGQLDWLWSAAEEAGLPMMVNVPEQVEAIGDVAEKHEGLRLIIDHAGVVPYETYTDLTDAIAPVLGLAAHPNVAVKVSGLPSSVEDDYPFPSLRAPIEQLFDVFGPERLFWGSDLTRLPCTLSQAVTHFTEELEFLSPADLNLIMGRALCHWLDWPV